MTGPVLASETDWPFWPPTIVWAREKGWLNVQDPVDGTWFSIPAKGAPTGYARIAMEAKPGQQRSPQERRLW